MSIERYLCVGGVEVANPCRTAAYLARLGNPCLPHPPDGSCCCCPDWLPEGAADCSMSIEAGFEFPCMEHQNQPPVADFWYFWTEDGADRGYPGPGLWLDYQLPSNWLTPGRVQVEYSPNAPAIVGPPTAADVPGSWSTWVTGGQPCATLVLQPGGMPGDLDPDLPFWFRFRFRSPYGCNYQIPIYFPTGWPSDPSDFYTLYVQWADDAQGQPDPTGFAAYVVQPAPATSAWSGIRPEPIGCECVPTMCFGWSATGSNGTTPTWAARFWTSENCEALPPAPPPFSDPGWSDPFPGSGTIGNCVPVEIIHPDQCGYYHVTWTLPGTDLTASALMRMTSADLGTAGVSFDGGATWTTNGTHEVTGSCQTSGTASYTITLTASNGVDQACFGPSGLTGSPDGWFWAELAAAEVPSPTPGDLPPVDSPAWQTGGSGLMNLFETPLVGCAYYGSGSNTDGFYSFAMTDQTTGYTVRVIYLLRFSEMGPGTYGGSMVSFDGGASWTPMVTGQTQHTWTFAGAGAGSGRFDTPAEDDAPWYDPDVPESADVLGVWIEEARLSVPWSRNAAQALRGASLGPGRLGGRELQVAGWLYARTTAATAYGRQWLFEALAGSPCEEGCDLPDAEVWTFCDPNRPNAGHRTLKRVGLTAFDPGIEPDFPRSCGFKFEATITAEVPELFLEPVAVADLAMVIDPATTVCTFCSPCPELEEAPCSCGQLGQPPRVVPVPDPASSYCLPGEVARFCTALPAPNFWRDATAVIRVEAGRWASDPNRPGLANLRIRGWQNPVGLTDPDLFQCQEPCLDIEVGCIPPGSTLTIDGTTRSALLTCAGEDLNGYAYLSSSGGRRFSWPDVSCHGLLVCVEADPTNTAPGGRVQVDLVTRERG